MSDPQGDLVEHYRQYLERFDAIAGSPTDFGAFIKHNGRLVKKMRYDEFEPVYTEYHDITQAYFDSIERGDTINDITVKLIRDRATDLVRPSPV